MGGQDLGAHLGSAGVAAFAVALEQRDLPGPAESLLRHLTHSIANAGGDRQPPPVTGTR
ncbi:MULTISPECIES: hypothetical protein [unclassified Pseudonocardia]|uniref:hypothetical protein n=1 Tax=unclassified Pseudonocardia TaxID=2619320 RepID=UPI001D04C959|nr:MULTISPECIES: hypothetical protein [unclassified Pseudonocardia]